MKGTGERQVITNLNDHALEHLHRYAIAMELACNKNVVDIASGEGYGSNLLSDVALSVIGIDVSHEAVNHASKKYKRANLKYIQGNADNIPIETNSVDLVVSFETIEHHDKHQEMMLEIKRILKSDGILIMSTPDKLNYTDIPKANNLFHVKELYFEEYKKLIESNFGYSIFLQQKVIHSSFIFFENIQQKGILKEYRGGFDKIETTDRVLGTKFNIAIASQKKFDFYYFSIFDGALFCKKQINELLCSKKYKLGYYLTYPYIVFTNLFRKKTNR